MDCFGSGKAVDGMNEKGLSYGALYLPSYAQYQTVPQGKDEFALSYQSLGDWLLENFSSTEQVKEAIKKIYVFAKPQTFGSYKNVVFPLYFIVTDASGKSITIEYVKGKLHVYDNPLGILTNSPAFDWQLINLKNYVNLSPYAPKTINIDGYTYAGTGQGLGLLDCLVITHHRHDL